jgi:hypothetical protein
MEPSSGDLRMGQVSVLSEGGSPSGIAARYQNARVVVHYNNQSGFNDTGTITYLDDRWVELTKDNGERLLIPVGSIRILKWVETSRSNEEAGSLLRPVESRPELERRLPK